MLIAWTRDFTLIRSVLTHPSQARMSSEDATDVAAWTPSQDERVWYVAAQLDDYDPVRDLGPGELVGVFTFIPQNSVCYEIHAAVLPLFWGKQSREALRAALEFFWANTFNLNGGVGVPRVVASIPAYNALAVKLAKDVGFRAFGRNRESFLKHGKLHDQILLGISK